MSFAPRSERMFTPEEAKDVGEGWSGLDAALEPALAPFRAERSDLGVLFSGGLDSALLAWELRRCPRLALSTVGTPHSPDLSSAEAGAAVLGVPWTPVTVASDEVLELARQLEDETRGLSRVARSVHVAFALAVERAPVRTLLCGQGADELFLGYAHYRGLSPSEAKRRSEQDLEHVLKDDWPRSQRIARRLGRTVHAPYLERGFVDAALRVPIVLRLPHPMPKAFFRAWARHRGLPEVLAQRPKRALQFGSGVDRILRRGR
jgi:asparagine synthase (glutamine-hydrolysing)